MKRREDLNRAFADWLNRPGRTAKGTIAGSLVVLERLKKDYTLEIDAHTAAGGSQVIGAGGSSVRKILERFGETRPFLSEGGRTNRGLRGKIKEMLDLLGEFQLDKVEPTRRGEVLSGLQHVLVQKVQELHSRERLKPEFDPSKTAFHFVHQLLELAREDGKAGPVAQYLVGAKLQLRFPRETVENKSFSTADQQLGRSGDFELGKTAFHVTVAPMPGVFERCKQNLKRGLAVYLIVPHGALEGTRQNAELTSPGEISVTSIEGFVSQNVDELSGFSISSRKNELRALIETYNSRVDQIENDKSMLIDIPANL